MTSDTLKTELNSKGYSINESQQFTVTDDKMTATARFVMQSEADGTLYDLDADNLHDALVEAITRLGFGVQQLTLF